MKKFLIVASLVLAFVSAKAQSEVGQWSIRPTVGMNLGFMSNSEDCSARVGLVIGTELEYQATNTVGLSAGLLYSQQGCKVDDAGTIKLDYINIPLLANVYVAKGFAVKLGLQPGFLINDKAKVSESGVSVEAGLGDWSKNFVLSVPVGISYEFSNIQLDARYNWGVTHALSAEGESSNSSAFMITVGYKFNL
ncbi:MAG: porin family protein [Muribaculaceae bacterium]